VQTCRPAHFDVHCYGVPLQLVKLYSYKARTKFLHLHGRVFYVLLNVILRVHNLILFTCLHAVLGNFLIDVLSTF